MRATDAGCARGSDESCEPLIERSASPDRKRRSGSLEPRKLFRRNIIRQRGTARRDPSVIGVPRGLPDRLARTPGDDRTRRLQWICRREPHRNASFRRDHIDMLFLRNVHLDQHRTPVIAQVEHTERLTGEPTQHVGARYFNRGVQIDDRERPWRIPPSPRRLRVRSVERLLPIGIRNAIVRAAALKETERHAVAAQSKTRSSSARTMCSCPSSSISRIERPP